VRGVLLRRLGDGPSRAAAARGAFVAGLLGGVAIVLKPVAVPLLAVVALAVLARARRENSVARSGAAMLAGTLVVPGIVVAYFGARGGLSAMIDVVVRANAYYVDHERRDPDLYATLGSAWWNYRNFAPFVSDWSSREPPRALRGAPRRSRSEGEIRARGRHALAAVGCVVVQRKLYIYHWSLATGAVGFAAALLARDALRFAPLRARPAAPLAIAAIAAALFAASGRQWLSWRTDALITARYALGRASREEFIRRYEQRTGPPEVLRARRGRRVDRDAYEPPPAQRRRRRPDRNAGRCRPSNPAPPLTVVSGSGTG